MENLEEKKDRFWFVQTPLKLLFDVDSVSDSAFRLYCVLQSYSFHGNIVFPSNETLSKNLGKSKDRITRLISQLVKAGWISRESRKGTVLTTLIHNPSVKMAQSSDLRAKQTNVCSSYKQLGTSLKTTIQGSYKQLPELEEPLNNIASLTRSKKKERKEPNSREPDPLPIKTTPERIEYLESLAAPAGERPPAAGARRSEKKVKGDLKKIDGIMKEAGLK